MFSLLLVKLLYFVNYKKVHFYSRLWSPIQNSTGIDNIENEIHIPCDCWQYCILIYSVRNRCWILGVGNRWWILRRFLHEEVDGEGSDTSSSSSSFSSSSFKSSSSRSWQVYRLEHSPEHRQYSSQASCRLLQLIIKH